MARLGLLLAVAVWGASFIATKLALREVSPAVIVFGRNAFGALLLAGIVWRSTGMRWLPLRVWPSLALLGFLGTTFHQWLQATGLQTASATVTAWIVTTVPVFVALLGWLFLKERIGGQRVVGMLVAALGVTLVASKGRPVQLFAGQVGTSGDGLIVLSALNWAVYTVVSKRLISSGFPGSARGADTGSTPLLLLLYGVFFGWLLSVPWLLSDGGWRRLASLSPTGWGALVFLGLACSGLAYLFWYRGLESVDATQVGAFLYLEPLVTTALAASVLGEPVTAPVALGGAAILLGVWLVNRG
jgi:drug/metabolite transporter (DMT)-like permease